MSRTRPRGKHERLSAGLEGLVLMNVVKEQGRNRGKTQHYMLKADPTLLRSCWEGEEEEREDGEEAVK